MKIRISRFLPVLAGLCVAAGAAEAQDEARQVHEGLLTLDTHLDTPANLANPDFDITEHGDPFTDHTQVDLPRMKEGGLDGGFWVIYTSQGDLTEEAYHAARDGALMRAVAIREMVAAHPDDFALATKPEDAARIVAEGKRIVYQSIENSYPLGEDISLLETFYDLGVRMVGPVHFANNQFADSATDPDGPDWGGLSPAGRELVKKANELGMILDASHASDDVLRQMIELSATPVILSHSGVRALYDHPRNVGDELLLALAESGGVIQMNAYSAYIADIEQDPARTEAMDALRKVYFETSNPTPEQMAAMEAERRRIEETWPEVRASFEVYMEQVLHALDLLGPEHVGFGADWDGGGGLDGLEDVSAIPKITERLLEEGYTEEELEMMWSGNVLRLLAAAEDYAATLSSEVDEE